MKDKEKYFCIFIVIAILATIFSSYMKKNSMVEQKILEELEDKSLRCEDLENDILLENEECIEEYIYVHIDGAVKKPGLIRVKNGTRLAEAIDICKGMEENACLDRINLALKLVDEQKVYIPKIGEEFSEFKMDISHKEETDNLVNINEASKEELTKLPGIGIKTAEKIIVFRENRRFRDIHDLKEVPGIGEGKFNQVENLITTK